MFILSIFVPLLRNISISDADASSASLDGPHLGRSPLQYFNSQNGSASSPCVNFVQLSIALSDTIMDTLIANLHTESSFLCDRDCCSLGTL